MLQSEFEREAGNAEEPLLPIEKKANRLEPWYRCGFARYPCDHQSFCADRGLETDAGQRSKGITSDSPAR
jgi:hypothetical protein